MVGLYGKKRRSRAVREFYAGRGAIASGTCSDFPIATRVGTKLPENFMDLMTIRTIVEKVLEGTASDFDHEEHLDRDDKLTVEEIQRFPACYSTLRNHLERCLRMKSFKLLSPSVVSEIIVKCKEAVKDLSAEDANSVCWSYGTSPTKFFLKKISNLDLSRFLKYWLTAQCRGGCLKQVVQTKAGKMSQDLQTDLRVGNIVAAEFSVDKYWYRAELVEIRGQEAKCFFVDYGNEEIVSVQELRHLPKHIAEIPRMAFQAKLAGFMLPDDKIEGDVMLEFITKIKNTKRMNISKLMPLRGAMGFEVVLEDASVNPPFQFHEMFSELQPNDDTDGDLDLPVRQFRDDEPVEMEKNLVGHGSEEFSPPMPLERKRLGLINTFKIVGVVDPDEIYVRNLKTHGRDDLKTLQTEMKHFYSSKSSTLYEIKTSRVLRNRVYAWYNRGRDSETSIWERVRVERTDMPPGKAYVQRVDVGTKVIVDIDDMMELSPSFWKQPPMAELAHLVHIQPRNNGVCWPRSTCEALKVICSLGDFYDGITLSWEAESRASETVHRKWDSLGLLLFFDDPRYTYSVQGILGGLGLAEVIGPGAGQPFVIFADAIPFFSAPSQNHYDCNNGGGNSMNGTVGHVNGYTNGDYTNSLDFGGRLDVSKPEFSIIGDVESLRDMKLINPAPAGFLDDEVRSHLGWIEFCRIDGPGNFYLHAKQKQSELFEMMESLGEKIENGIRRGISETFETGEVVAVRWTHQLNHETYKTCWNRAFVFKLCPDLRQARVILLDFGIEICAKYEHIQPLPSQYTEILPFCSRAHLEIGTAIPAGCKGWSSDADYKFMEYIKRWSVVSPVYLAMRKTSDSGIIKFTHFDQRITYDRSSKTWTALDSQGKNSKDYAILDEYRSHKLLRHLFRSIGLEIYYEDDLVGGENCEPFEPVWNTLVEYLLTPTNDNKNDSNSNTPPSNIQ